MEIRKILAYGIRMQKNPQARADIFFIFTDFNEVMQVLSPTYTPARKFHLAGNICDTRHKLQ